MSQNSGIYKIQSVIYSERIYIGSAISLSCRKNQHFSKLRKNKHSNKKLQNHFNKYGESDLRFSILLRCEISELIDKEQLFIDSDRPWFNIRLIAKSNLGLKQTEESNEKRRQKLKGIPNGNQYGKKNKGLVRSDELKKIWSDLKQGEKHNMFGKHHSEETLKRMRKPHKKHKGHPMSEKGKQILREIHLGEKNQMYNKVVSEKTRDKLRESTKRIWEERKLNKVA